MNVFHHTGDLGDVIAALPVIRELGGGELVISHTQYPWGKGPRESLRGKRYEALQPIFAATNYLKGISYQHPPENITHDIALFREKTWRTRETLTQWQGRWFDLNLPEAPSPWLSIPNAKQHGRIVVGRTHRYHTDFFPWRPIVEKYHKDILFLGLPSEYADFESHAKPRKIEWEQTENLLEAAEIIAGSSLFIGNQSVLFWIAAGLGVTLIQETHHQIYTRNSIIPRSNAFYTDTNKNLAKVYDKLELDKHWLQRFPVPDQRINLSTSAGDPRKNLSTSAELFQ